MRPCLELTVQELIRNFVFMFSLVLTADYAEATAINRRNYRRCVKDLFLDLILLRVIYISTSYRVSTQCVAVFDKEVFYSNVLCRVLLVGACHHELVFKRRQALFAFTQECDCFFHKTALFDCT